MSEIDIKSWKIEAAKLGPNNILPPIFPERDCHQIKAQENIPQEIIDGMKEGYVRSTLPYSMQDDYTRQLSQTETEVAILENEVLRATFLLERGGRLWSLLHKPSGRELLEVNPVIQFANLAIRNAWFSGGVEWNIGTLGHSPFCCDRLFAALLTRTDGTPILRFYEWERFRQVSFQIDIYLPPGSPVLLLYVRIFNPNLFEVPMYWWSNIAVPETPGTRVITPADTAYCLGFKPNTLVKVPIPFHDKVDLTYSGNYSHAADVFFHIPINRNPWIAAVDTEGKGLIHTSTKQLAGRKMWAWGMGPGGKNWQKFLSPPGKGYLEIQAGLTRTQLEHLTMPGGSELSWMEAYGMIETDPNKIHQGEWHEAQENVQAELDLLISNEKLYSEYEISGNYSHQKPDLIMQRGSGWGSLERLRREIDKEVPFCSQGLIFDDDALGEEQMPWVQLLQEGTFPVPEVNQPPGGFLVNDKWRQKLQQAINNNAKDNWFAFLHLGLMNYFRSNFKESKTSWERSLELNLNPWAMRNLAMLCWKDNQLSEAANLLSEAHALTPLLLPLTIELGKCLVEDGQYCSWLEYVEKMPETVRQNGRIRLLEAQAALEVNELQIVRRFFEDLPPVADLREGENSLTDLWFAYHEKRICDKRDEPINNILLGTIKEQTPLSELLDFRISQQ